MLEVFMLLLDPSPPALPLWSTDLASTTVPEIRRCDDGSRPFHLDGRPNWGCRIDGCGPLELICWPERVEFCFDEFGEDTGECDWDAATKAAKSCNGWYSCLKLWAGCDGTWGCAQAGVECTCTPIPPTKTDPTPGSALVCSEDYNAIENGEWAGFLSESVDTDTVGGL